MPKVSIRVEGVLRISVLERLTEWVERSFRAANEPLVRCWSAS
jgi:hypothetical protein